MRKLLKVFSLSLLGLSLIIEFAVAGTSSLRKVSLQIDGAAVPYYAPLYWAQQKGYFAQEGLDVEFYYAAASDIVKNVAAGNVEFGFPNADAVVLARSRGVPIKVAHTTYQHGLGALIFKSEKTLASPADLKGKRIAVTSLGSPNYIQLQVMLKNAGLSVQDVTVEIIGTGAILNALMTDQVDAIVFSMLRTIELQNAGVNASEIRSDTYLPSFGNVLIVSDSLAQKDRALIESFTRALNKALKEISHGQIAEAVDLAIEQYSPTFAAKRDVVIQSIEKVFIPYLWNSDYTNTHGLGASDPERWKTLIDKAVEYGVITSSFDANELFIAPQP